MGLAVVLARQTPDMRPTIPTLLLSLPLMACAPQDDPTPTRGDDQAEERADGYEPVCLQGAPFVADGPVSVDAREAGDAQRVQELRWQRHDGCERFVIDLVDEDGAPASTAGSVAAEVRRRLGVVRVSLRDVAWVDPGATDATFDGELARSAYAVWSPDGRWTYVDVHLAAGAEAFVTLLEDPARVVVDLRPGGGPLPPPPASGRRVVVLEPRPGPASYPLTITGYARTFEANVVARLEQGGEEVLETFTTATAWVDAWGHFSFTIDDGPTGPVRLHVGEYEARDGAWEGVVVELRMR
jgi:hypothetical protein